MLSFGFGRNNHKNSLRISVNFEAILISIQNEIVKDKLLIIGYLPNIERRKRNVDRTKIEH